MEKNKKEFPDPFAYICANFKVSQFCSYCLRQPDDKEKKLSLCGACEFARYCDKDCQRLAWKSHHKAECARLNRVFPNLPLTEVLFIARITERVMFIDKHGDTQHWQKERKFADLMHHSKEQKKDKEKMAHFEKIYEKTKKFYGEGFPDKEAFFLIYCRSWINSHTVHNSVGQEVGMALDLGVSKYDHSCRPTCSLVFDGFKATFRALVPGIDLDNTKEAFISYIDVGRSRYLRKKELKTKWYFDCKCARCSDPDDDWLTSLKCVNAECDGALPIAEDAESCDIGCNKCHKVAPESYVKQGQELMLQLPAKYEFSDDAEEIGKLRDLIERCRSILHPQNIYLCRMITAYMSMKPDDEQMANSDMHKLVYANYKRCFPETDRHRGYQLLHLVKSLIEQQRRDEALDYAYEAMQIFEICFGLDHPYYLQTLALWTFLNEKRPKSDQELLALMNFHYNKPVDVGGILAQKNLMLPKIPHIIKQHQAATNGHDKENGHALKNLEDDH